GIVGGVPGARLAHASMLLGALAAAGAGEGAAARNARVASAWDHRTVQPGGERSGGTAGQVDESRRARRNREAHRGASAGSGAVTSTTTVATRPRRAIPIPLAVIVALVGLLVIALGFGTGAGVAAAGTTVVAASNAPKTFDSAHFSPAEPAGAQPLRTCSLDGATAQPGALTFHGYAINSQTGDVLFNRRADSPNPTASTMKLVTAAAALTVLGPDYRIPTRVYAGELEGEVVLVGSGDVTLSSLAPGQASYYSGTTAFLSDLAEQTMDARGDAAITSVSYDESFYDGDQWHPTWNEQDRIDGYISPISALTVDGGRQEPPSLVSQRTERPAEEAVTSFTQKLGLGTDAIIGSAGVPEGATMLGEVWSQPVSELIRYALLDSDNVMAETLARLVAVESGTGNTFDAINPAMNEALGNLGLDTTGLDARDGSGLSGDDRVTARLEVELLQLIGSDEFGLGQIRETLPRSGTNGTLSSRFNPAVSGVPAGAITAKTGWIEDVYGLAGYIDAADGTRITFAYYVVGTVQISNRDVLDSIAAATYNCGGDLADW
ncbi:MAG: D-alanyl-D-alanine carboxypeptidase/D-alanyl-D-alanine endopeptidase, partial [Pseudoclavibacter sp.]